MIISVDFNIFVTFDCNYGRWDVDGDTLRVFVEKGLAIKNSKV